MHVNLTCQGGDVETKGSMTISQGLEVIVTSWSDEEGDVYSASDAKLQFYHRTHLYLKDFSDLLSEESQNLGLIHLCVSFI